jgi:hypothetical protein
MISGFDSEAASSQAPVEKRTHDCDVNARCGTRVAHALVATMTTNHETKHDARSRPHARPRGTRRSVPDRAGVSSAEVRRVSSKLALHIRNQTTLYNEVLPELHRLRAMLLVLRSNMAALSRGGR